MNKYALIFGTRPEIVKFAPLIYELQRRKLDFFIIHTGQHDRAEMSTAFLAELDLPTPTYFLQRRTPVFQAAEGVQQIINILCIEQPDVVLVQGDTNSTLAGALAAKAAGIRLAHVEAGLRGGEIFTKEEQNTRQIATMADYHFAPCLRAVAELQNEGITDQVYFVGNTIVDITLQKIAQLASASQSVLDQYNVTAKRFLLFTTHKAEIVDDPDNLVKIIAILTSLTGLELPILLPLHPRTANNLAKHGLALPASPYLRVLPCLGYAEFLLLEKAALCLLTDGGGVQEECCVLGTPVLILKSATQRPCVVAVGAATICGLDQARLVYEVQALRQSLTPRRWQNPFGHGDSAKQIIMILEMQLTKQIQEGSMRNSWLTQPAFPGVVVAGMYAA